MEREIKIILVKFFLITAGTIGAVFAIMFGVSMLLDQVVFGQFDTPNQFQNPQMNQFDQQNQFGQQQQFQDPNQFNQYSQQPYQQYGTPTYSQYGMQQPTAYYAQQPVQPYNSFGITEIIKMLIAAGGGAAGGKYVADRRTKSLEELHKDTMNAELKTKEQLKELARVTYTLNADKANMINDAPSVQLGNLEQDANEFREKTAKA